MSARKINVTLGTAGHIDHGKTALVRNLTGCETDRLKEEKERGMSIELGFAPCSLGDIEVGLVDVPGHENFIRTMVAGVTGIDCVIFVVAADDGVMPQTREHLDILSILGIRSGVVALTKIDRVPPDRRDESAAQVRALLQGTFLATAPIIPVSNTDGEGLMDLRETLARVVADLPPRDCGGIFRVPIERAFAVRGHGTVVTGIPVAGRVEVGEELELFSVAPSSQKGRIRSMQVYGLTSQGACAGQCCALNVPSWDHGTIRRGDVAALPGRFSPSRWLLLRIRLLPGVPRLRNAARIRLHTGTAEALASLYPLDSDPVDPGADFLAQAFLGQPLVAGMGDHFIVRSLGPIQTIGGGIVLGTTERRLRRSRPETISFARDLDAAIGDNAARVACSLLHRAEPIARVQDLAREAQCQESEAACAIRSLKQNGDAITLDAGGVIHRVRLESFAARTREALAAFHSNHPDSPGPDRRELATLMHIEVPFLERLLPALVASHSLVVQSPSNRFSLPGHRSSMADADRPALERIERAFAENLFHPPEPESLARSLSLAPTAFERLVRVLLDNALLVRMPDGMLFHRDAVNRAAEIARNHIGKEGRLESVQFKYLLDTTRKYALPLLDHLDRIGVTRRFGNTRTLK